MEVAFVSRLNSESGNRMNHFVDGTKRRHVIVSSVVPFGPRLQTLLPGKHPDDEVHGVGRRTGHTDDKSPNEETEGHAHTNTDDDKHKITYCQKQRPILRIGVRVFSAH